jgi:hypothetical protein
MTYAAGEWVNDTGGFSARLSCDGIGWVLSFDMDTFGPSTVTCAPFELDMDMTGNSYGITSLIISG